MNRRNLFQGLVAMVMGQGIPPLICTEKDGFIRCVPPEPLKEGEERCPLGHGQKPSAYLKPRPIWDDPSVPTRKDSEMSTDMQAFYYHARWVEEHVCSTCGIVYVKPEPKK